MDDKKKNTAKGCGCGCLSVIILAIIIVMVSYGCSGGKVDPNNQAESELKMLDNHYNEIKTDIGNLNVTGHGDFVNMMDEQIDFAQASISDLNDDYGDESEVINLCKQAWTDLSGMARAAKDGIANNDASMATILQQAQSDYEATVQQIKNRIQE